MEMLYLINQYNSEGRYYHNFMHVARMFDDAKENKLELSKEQQIAILYHDVVYVCGAKDSQLPPPEVGGL